MKFGQLIKYIVKNSFLQQLYRKWGRDSSLVPELFLFFLKKFYVRENQVVSTFILIYFGRQYNLTIEKNFITFQAADLEIYSIMKGPGTSFSTSFCLLFFKKNIYQVIIY